MNAAASPALVRAAERWSVAAPLVCAAHCIAHAEAGPSPVEPQRAACAEAGR